MSTRENLKLQWVIAVVGVVLFLAKVVAWYLTNSVAVLTDALESIVNVISGFVGLYSLYLSAQPRDENHPYGHGKAEFVSAAIEGTLIFVAGLVIVYEGVRNLLAPPELGKLDAGLILVGATALVTYGLGVWAVRRGNRTNSAVLVASGRHLQTDTYSTLGIILGLVLVMVTDLVWVDSVVALLFAVLIMVTGYKIVRGSLAGIMDEADEELLKKVVAKLEASRSPRWVDLHNLRIIKYGDTLHLDCHLTVPWYLNVHEAHQEIEALAEVVRTHFGDRVELFVHTDGCLDFSCAICSLSDCPVRKAAFVRRVGWTVENIAKNHKHRA